MGRRGRPPHPDILTPREWEVLALLRERLTNEQIAARLGITLDGAKYHVSEILSKLGVATREEAADWTAAQARPWWQRLIAFPTAAGIAGAATIVAATAGIAVLAWGVLGTSDPNEDAGDNSHSIINAGQPDRYQVDEPVHFDEGGFWLVKRESGEIIALSDTDTHPASSTPQDCLIEWRSEMFFNDRSGWFRGKCSGSNFGLDGQVASGPSPRAMGRFPVTIDDDVTVDTTVTLCGPGYIPPRSPCLP